MKNKKYILTTVLTCILCLLTATAKNPLVGTLLKEAVNVATTAKKVHDQQKKFKNKEKEPAKVSSGILSLINKSKTDSSSSTENNFEDGNLSKEGNTQTESRRNLTDNLYSSSDVDTITVSSDVLTKDDPVYNVQQIHTYNGTYPNRFQRVYMLNLTATYDYYENEEMTRVYHGPFCLKFKGGGEGQRIGSIKGQFSNGYYNGDWTLVYPYRIFAEGNYTATLKCSFEEGKLNGPLEVVVTNSNNKVVAKTVVQYKNDNRDGEITHFCNLKYTAYKNLHGQYKDNKRSGKWVYSHGENQGFAIYDENGNEISNYVIDSQTGEKENDRVWMTDLDYGDGISAAILLHVIADISIDKSKRSTTFWAD